jgi:hypothetical protein
MSEAHCNRSTLFPHEYASPPSMLGWTSPNLGGPARREVDPFFFAAPGAQIWCVGGLRLQIQPVEGPSERGAQIEGGWDFQRSPCDAHCCARHVDAAFIDTCVCCLCLPGTKKMVEGVYEQGAKCLVVEDVVTSGMSVLETTASLKVRYLSPLFDEIFLPLGCAGVFLSPVVEEFFPPLNRSIEQERFRGPRPEMHCSTLLADDVCRCVVAVFLLQEEGLVCTHAVVLLDRQQGGPERITDGGVTLRSVLTVTTFIEVLEKAGKLDAATAGKVRQFVKENQFDPSSAGAPKTTAAPPKMATVPYGKRAETAGNELAKKLLAIMEDKQTNLSVAADLNTCKEVRRHCVFFTMPSL